MGKNHNFSFKELLISRIGNPFAVCFTFKHLLDNTGQETSWNMHIYWDRLGGKGGNDQMNDQTWKENPWRAPESEGQVQRSCDFQNNIKVLQPYSLPSRVTQLTFCNSKIPELSVVPVISPL